jgi:predicted DNA-binding transcriptional regulator AlpA
MSTAFREIEQAKGELAQVRAELIQLEKHLDRLHESVRKASVNLFGPDQQAFSRLDEVALASKISQILLSRISVITPNPSSRKQYIREREAAEYMGVKVSTLRAWRIRRSSSGPPFLHIGRMVLYPIKALEEHMQQRILPRRS